ncbi:hypothetical protein CHUAL_008845 [Chamberlinius hualienensis]
MKLGIGSLFLISCCAIIVKANVVPERQSKKDATPMLFPTVQAESFSYSTGASIYNDCETTTVGNLKNGGMLRFDNIDIGVDEAKTIRIRYSNKAVGESTTVELYNVHPSSDGATALVTVVATRTYDWCDFAEVTGTIAAPTPFKGIQRNLYLKFTTSDPTSSGFDFDYFSFGI